MDRTSWIVVVLCSIGIAFLMLTRKAPPEVTNLEEERQEQVENSSVNNGVSSAVEDSAQEEVVAEESNELVSVVTLESDTVRYHFAHRGGGIARAEMITDLNSGEGQEKEFVEINRYGEHAIGALAFATEEFEQALYEFEQLDERSLQATATLANGIEVTKTWSLPTEEEEKGEGYLIDLRVELTAPKGIQLDTDQWSLGLGSITALQVKEAPNYTTVAWQDGKNYESEHVNWFKGFRLLWLFETRAPSDLLQKTIDDWWWSGIMNQFYVTQLSAAENAGEQAGRIWAKRIPVLLPEENNSSSKQERWAMVAASSLGRIQLQEEESVALDYQYYIGPKKYSLLRSVGGKRSEALDYAGIPVFGWIPSPFSKMLNLAMNTMASWLKAVSWNFALAIILVTVIVRVLMWPLHARAQRTMKRMSKLKPKMDALKEKFKDDPARQQKETMQLMGEYGVNPVGGCLPMLLQMPIFFGYYRMLFFASELRHEQFLWITDLSQPDTVGYIFGIPINPLPLVMSAFSVLQLKLTPKTGDATQRQIMYIMPVFMLVICYGFASALALYWTVSNIFTIVQMLIMQKLPEPELVKKQRKTFAQRVEEMQAQRAQMANQRNGKTPAKNKKNRPRTGG